MKDKWYIMWEFTMIKSVFCIDLLIYHTNWKNLKIFCVHGKCLVYVKWIKDEEINEWINAGKRY